MCCAPWDDLGASTVFPSPPACSGPGPGCIIVAAMCDVILLYTRLLPSKVSLKDATGCAATSHGLTGRGRYKLVNLLKPHIPSPFFSLEFSFQSGLSGLVPNTISSLVLGETFAAGDFPWDGLFGKSDVNCKFRLSLS